jgi:hypothetical protein
MKKRLTKGITIPASHIKRVYSYLYENSYEDTGIVVILRDGTEYDMEGYGMSFNDSGDLEVREGISYIFKGETW